MSVLIKVLEMPETEYVDVRIFRDGTATIATGTKPYYRELKAEPVRHGEWISKMVTRDGEYAGWICSNCGYFTANSKACFYNYCPNCGARMDKDE